MSATTPPPRADDDGASHWITRQSTLLCDCLPWVQVYRNQVELPSGALIDDFYHVRLPDYSIIAATTSDNHVLVVRGYQYGIDKTHLSFPAGMIDPG